MKNSIVKFDSPELNVIESSKAEQIKATFEPMADMLEKFEDAYNGILSEYESGISKELTLKAKRLRIDIGKVRIETEKIRKEQKEEYLRAGKAIDGVSNILKWAVTDKENRLKEIEDHYEIQEKKRLEELQSLRAEKLSKYVDDAYERNLSSMEEDVWNAYYATKKKEHEDRIAAEKKAEADRIAREREEAKERERIRKENEELRKQVEERERIAKIEAENRAKEESERAAREEKERKEREEKERIEREKYEAKIRAEREERERIEKEEREKREKAEAELRERLEAERRAKEEEEARIQADLNKGDAAKVDDLLSDLETLKTKYSFKSSANKNMYSEVNEMIDSVIAHIQRR